MKFYDTKETENFMINMPKGNLVEFGVYIGNNLWQLIKSAMLIGNDFTNAYGFDSFQGLPQETKGIYHNPAWEVGTFNLVKDLNLQSIEHAIQVVRNRVGNKAVLIPGWFEDTCNEYWGNILHDSVSYIHVDCDLHSSAKTCLEFSFKYKICKPGCIFRFDDIASTPANAGEQLALDDCTKEFDISWEQLGTNVFIYRGQKI